MGLDAEEIRNFYYASGNEELPGVYAPPDGRMLVASYLGRRVGCGAFRKVSCETCEMKRMYVRPEFRGMGVGRKLAETLIVAARGAGYGIMRLETATFMDKAISMYVSLGFKDCRPYYVPPERFRAITVFMELDLANAD